MDTANRISTVIETNFHPVSHHDTPRDVLRDETLSTGEKRMILSSWASDMYAVDSNPAWRKDPGTAHATRLSEILAALRELDGNFDPPRGGAAMRTWRPISLDLIGRKAAAAHHRRPSRRSWVAACRRPQSLIFGAGCFAL